MPLTHTSFVRQPKAGRIETVICRIVRGTTISGEQRAKHVNPGDIVEITAQDFGVLEGQKQAVRLTPEELAKLDKGSRTEKRVTDSAGNAITTR